MDENLEKLIEDLFTLEHALGNDDDPGAGEVAREYILANRSVIDAGVEAWRSLSEEQRTRMDADHRELDVSATRDDFFWIATGIFIRLEDQSPLLPVTRDKVHMLRRVLQFAVYAADTSNLQLRMHPVSSRLI